MWFCEICGNKNNNSSVKCRHNKCHAPKPQHLIDEERTEFIRDYCPNCKTHRDFKHISGRIFKCPGCHRKCKFKGEPVPEIKLQELQDKLNEAVANDKSHVKVLSQ